MNLHTNQGFLRDFQLRGDLGLDWKVSLRASGAFAITGN